MKNAVRSMLQAKIAASSKVRQGQAERTALQRELANMRATLDGADTGNAIPYARFQRFIAQFRKLEDKLSAIEQRDSETVAQMRARLEREQSARKKLQRERDTLTSERESWAQEREIMAAGITDPEGIEFARLAWQRLPADKRPDGGLSAWLQGGEGLPRALQPYLPQGHGGGGAQGASQGTQRRVPDPNAGARQYTTAPRARDVPTDLEQYRAERDQLWGGQAPTYPWSKPQGT